MTDIEPLLSSYPRRRPPLPEPYRAIHERERRQNREGGDWANRLALGLEGWMHRRVAAGGGPGSVLELGAGSLNHLPYERAEAYDIVEPCQEAWRDSPLRGRVRNAYRDVRELPAEAAYDRVISVAVLEHLESLPDVVARAALALRPGGVFQAGIPSEGGALWGLAWRCTTGAAYRLRTGLAYGVMMRYEHLSCAPEILAVVGWFFGRVLVRRFPLGVHHLSFYAYIEAREPRLERCRRRVPGPPGEVHP